MPSKPVNSWTELNPKTYDPYGIRVSQTDLEVEVSFYYYSEKEAKEWIEKQAARYKLACKDIWFESRGIDSSWTVACFTTEAKNGKQE